MDNLDKSERFWKDVVAWLVLLWLVATVVAGVVALAHAAYRGL